MPDACRISQISMDSEVRLGLDNVSTFSEPIGEDSRMPEKDNEAVCNECVSKFNEYTEDSSKNSTKENESRLDNLSTSSEQLEETLIISTTKKEARLDNVSTFSEPLEETLIISQKCSEDDEQDTISNFSDSTNLSEVSKRNLGI